MPADGLDVHRWAMKPAEILTLAIDAETYDAVVILWRTEHGTQPVLMPRGLGRDLPPATDRDPSDRDRGGRGRGGLGRPGPLPGPLRRTARLS